MMIHRDELAVGKSHAAAAYHCDEVAGEGYEWCLGWTQCEGIVPCTAEELAPLYSRSGGTEKW